MHSVNHPRIGCIFDVVQFVLQREGIKTITPPLIPHDNLKAMPGFPVYPEIAELCGVPGSLHFSTGDYDLVPMRAIIRRSFKIYDRYQKHELMNRQSNLPRFQGLEKYLASYGAPVR